MHAILLLLAMTTDWTPIVRPVVHQVARITALQGDDEVTCTGVVVKPGIVVTAAHCVPAGSDLTVNRRHAEVLRINHILDLAVLRFLAKDELLMPLAQASPAMGSEIAMCGFRDAALEMQCQFGHVAAVRDEDHAIVIDGTIRPGDSGGPVINAAGELVGLSFRFFPGTALGQAMPIEDIRDFIGDLQ
jgi:S1-C subfamily serine protease